MEAAAWRYERKFVVAGVVPREVELAVRRHPALFSEIFHGRCVNNLYLDTPDFASLRANMFSLASRVKTRVRWYGDFLGPIERPVLERKIKRGHRNVKESFGLPRFDLRPGLSARDIEALFASAGLPAETLALLRPLRPVLANRYSRRYFRSADGRFRLTLDEGVRFCPARSLDNTFLAWTAPAPGVILELKYAAEDDADADAITTRLPFRLERNSKFVSGVQQAHPFLA